MKVVDSSAKMVAEINLDQNHFVGPLTFDHDGIPTYEECRQMIRELAARKYSRTNGQTSDESNWLWAERRLFWQQENKLLYGGYRIYVRDMSKPLVDGYYPYYNVVVVTPCGPHFITKEDV
jgi:hypothetical protein